MVFNHDGFPIQKSPDHFLFADPRSLSQLTTSFFASRSQGILRSLFLSFSFVNHLRLNNVSNNLNSFCLEIVVPYATRKNSNYINRLIISLLYLVISLNNSKNCLLPVSFSAKGIAKVDIIFYSANFSQKFFKYFLP